MDPKRLVRISKFLSKHLRHQPERLGLVLEPGGWVNVDDLLSAAERNRFPIADVELIQVVERNDKQRFSFDAAGEKIRANQGHSAEVDLQLKAAPPPAVLYHGTGANVVAVIEAEGLKKMNRHHVHLSADKATAIRVGRRKGKAVVFRVAAANMAKDGHDFFCSESGVWLTEAVPPAYLEKMNASDI